MSQFIQNNIGLKEQHKNQNPLFEKTYIPPDYGERLISRVYPDGCLYYLNTNDNWNYISILKNEGLEDLKVVLIECCKVKNEIKADGNLKGVVIWKLQCESQINEIIIAGIPSVEYNLFQKIDDIINTKLQTIQKD
ncbi:MAG: hypothetical protein ABFS16_00250 [Bacteroidota bacterium]